jgi:hypothetical protein
MGRRFTESGPGSHEEVLMTSSERLSMRWTSGALAMASAFGVALASGACGGGTTSVGPTGVSTAAQLPAQPAAAPSEVTASAASGQPTIQAGGQGAFMDGPGSQRTFSLDAHAEPGGEAGHAELFSRAQGVRFNILFDCVRYDPTTRILLLGGAVTNTNGAGPRVGDRMVTAVQDNGQGAGAGPDEITGVLPAELLPFTCQDFPMQYVPVIVEPELRPISHGDIHVHVSN